MSNYINGEFGSTDKVVVFTKDGDKLIGFIVELNDSAQANPFLSFLASSDQKGIWLQRERHITFLGEDNIKQIRLARPGEKEIDKK